MQHPIFVTGSLPSQSFESLHDVRPGFSSGGSDVLQNHIRTCTDAYLRQVKARRFFFHEACADDPFWQSPGTLRLQEEGDVVKIDGPIYRWSAVGGNSFVRKRVAWMTNSRYLSDVLGALASHQPDSRRTVSSWHGVVGAHAAYPTDVKRALLEVVREELSDLAPFDACGAGPIPEDAHVPDGPWYEYWDDVNGSYLDKALVEEARATELQWVRKQQIYEIVPRKMCFRETGKRPIPLKWVDTNKGDATRVDYRSRIVAKEIKAKKSEDEKIPIEQLFSSMPTLKAT